MLRVTHPQLERYFAVLTAAGALALTLILWPLPGTPVALFVAAVAFSAWYGGLGPGLLATALSAVATACFLTILFARFGRSPPRKGALGAGFQIHLALPVEPAKLAAAVASLAGRAGCLGT